VTLTALTNDNIDKMRLNNKLYFFKTAFLLILLLPASSIFFACNSNQFYEKNTVIKNNSWYFKDSKVFEVELKDSLKIYNFYINVRNTIDYKYANLYLFINSELPDGKIAKDTVEFQIADYQGKWLGKGSGKFRYNSFLLRKNISFNKKGLYKFNLVHAMRSDSLKGIADVGIRIDIAK
jgi:gliding motility-associated lipoprotein GldH